MTFVKRLPWRRTWPDEPRAQDDFCVPARELAASIDVVRIRMAEGGPQDGRWEVNVARLTSQPDGTRKPVLLHEFQDTAAAAAERAERFYLDGE